MSILNLRNKEISRFHNLNGYNTTEYSFVTSYIWSDLNKINLYEDGNNKVLVINNINESITLIPLAYYKDYSSCIDLALKNINIDSIKEIRCVHEDSKDAFIVSLKDKFDIEEDRDSFDYIYEADKIRTLAGRKNSKKRNHLNYFLKEYEDRYEYKSLNEEDFSDCLTLLETWQLGREMTEDMINEHKAIEKIFSDYSFLSEYIKIGGVYIDGVLKAFSVGSMVNEDTAIVHIEKADAEIRGLYPFMAQQFLINEFADAKYVNREDDMGLENIRKSKMSYHPCCFAKKYKFIKNKINNID